MLARLRANPVLRTGFLAVALAFCGFGLAADWPQVQAALVRLHWYSVAGSFLAAAAGAGCMMLAWRAVVADIDSRLPVLAAIRVTSIAQVAKYVPGAIWAFAAQVELGRDYRISRHRGAAAVVISLAVALGTGLLVATVTLPIASTDAAHHYWWVILLAPLVGVFLLPGVLGWLLRRMFAIARRPPPERLPSPRGLLTAAAWSMLGWMFWGLHAWLLIANLTGRTESAILLALGAYALAWSVGILVVVFPGGIGPRDLAFVVVLAPVMPRGSALLVALVSRVVMTLSDVAWATTGLVIGRVTKHARGPATGEPATAVPDKTRGGKHRKPAAGPGVLTWRQSNGSTHSGYPGSAYSGQSGFEPDHQVIP